MKLTYQQAHTGRHTELHTHTQTHTHTHLNAFAQTHSYIGANPQAPQQQAGKIIAKVY